MNKTIKELIDKNKKNSRLNKEDSRLFEKEFLNMMQFNGFNEEIEEVLIKGPMSIVMDAYAKFLLSQEPSDAFKLLNAFISSNGIQQNESGYSGVKMAVLLEALVKNGDENKKLTSKAFSVMVHFSYKSNDSNKKCVWNQKVIDQIRKSVFPLFKTHDSLFDFATVKMKAKNWEITRELFCEAIIKTINMDEKLMSSAYKAWCWIKSAKQPMGKYNEEYIKKCLEQKQQQKEKNLKSKNEGNTMKESVSEMKSTDVTVVKKEDSNISKIETNAGIKTEEKTNNSGDQSLKVKNEEQKINSEKTEEPHERLEKVIVHDDQKIDKIVKLLQEQNIKFEIMKNEIASLKKIISEFDEKFSEQKNVISTQNLTINNLYSEKDSLNKEKRELEQKILSADDLIASLKHEVEESRVFAENVARNREKQSEEKMNKLASKLKVEYIDYRDAENIEMTVDLGENMRAQLGEVFSVLEKNGIKLS